MFEKDLACIEVKRKKKQKPQNKTRKREQILLLRKAKVFMKP